MLRIDDGIPGGNVEVMGVDGDEVTIRPDPRDTEGYWFYWYFRVTGAAGRTVTFHLDGGGPMLPELGPAVTYDGGLRWKWLGGEVAAGGSFTHRIPDDAADVRFSMGMPYTLHDLEAFLSGLKGNPAVETGELARTRKDRPVHMVRAGMLSGTPPHRILITARHHCCEMMASYAMEGLISSVAGDDGTGRWFRDNAEVLFIPFVDTDGVEDGDQGKNRRPRDHNRDYGDDPVHVETAAIKEFAPRWAQGRLHLALDLHCPYIRGGDHNQTIYMVGSSDPDNWGEQQRFGGILETVKAGPLPYRAEDNLPFGQGWNTGLNWDGGMSFKGWAMQLDGIRLATSFEIPYSAARGVEVNPMSARLFGRDLARAICRYLSAGT